MTENAFSELTKKHFDFLISAYGFSIVEETHGAGDPPEEGRIVFSSSSPVTSVKLREAGVQITLDHGNIRVDIGPLDLDRAEWFDLADAMQVIAPDIRVYEKPQELQDARAALETQLSRLADIVKNYCRQFFKGNFSLYHNIMEVRRSREEAGG